MLCANLRAGSGKICFIIYFLSVMIKAFCANAASFRIPNQDGATALIRAAKSGHCSIVKLLLEKGADVDKVNKVRNDKFML